MDLLYSSFVSSLLTAFPEVREQHEKLQEDIGPDVLPFLTVELVFEPFVKHLLKANANKNQIRRVFSFLEDMARTQDGEVVNLLYVGILEPWAADSELLARAWLYMEERTKQIAADAAHRLAMGKNLPRTAC